MASDGTITFSTKLDNTELDKALRQAERKIESLEDKIAGKRAEKTVYEQAMERLAAEAQEASASVGRLHAEYARLRSEYDAASGYADKSAIAERMAEVMRKSQAASEQMESAGARWDEYRDKASRADEQLAVLGAQLDRAKGRMADLRAEQAGAFDPKGLDTYRSRFAQLQERMRASAAKAAASIRASHQGGAAAIGAAYRGAGRAMRRALAAALPFAAAAGAARAFASRVRDVVLQGQEARASVNGLRAAIDGMAAGVATVATPAVIAFVRVLTTMVMTLARLADSIFRTDFAGHIAAQLQAASAGGAAAEAADEQAEATGRLAKAVKEANRQLMSFDELNVLAAEQSDDGSDGLDDLAGGAEGAGGGGYEPASLLDGIDATLAKIMLLAGAALLAVGIILTFSGANIPLGLALMAIGALMVYTAVSEQWDKMPTQVQDALTAVLAIAGAMLIAIGLVLCAAGQVPMGIAFIVAGAALLVMAVSLNPDMVPAMVGAMRDHILAVIAGALIVVGVMLCAAGHPVLGIAFIIAGAALFVMDAVLNWDSTPDSVKRFLVDMISVIGAALIVLGVILVATGHPALGIAAILVGVLIFVAAAELDDQEAPGRIRKFLSEMVPLIGKALIVVGLLLCVTGHPVLGIAAVLVGIAIWVTGAAITEGVPAQMIMDFIGRMLPEIGKAIVVLGFVLCVTGHIPLGVAAIVLGAAIWVTGAAIDENLMSEKVQNFIDNVLPIISGAMLVLGVILVASGVGIPLGIALIAAGAMGLVAAVALNSDSILEMIRGVWERIKSWWGSNVAHIFTVEYWKGVFKSIADGIWAAITGVGDTISGFFSGLGEGIGGILGGLGQSFSWVVPSFDFPAPRLASGAVIPPNREFMAVLGDQRRGMNLEGPEDMFRQIVREESGMGGGVEALLSQILDAVRSGRDVYMDGMKVTGLANRSNEAMARMAGA